MTVDVVYQSAFYNLSGYAAESRAMVRELDRRSFAVRISHGGPRHDEVIAPADRELLARLERTDMDPDRALFIVADPPSAQRPPSARTAVLRTMFEADRIHPEWVESARRFDEVWVPSAQSREAFVGSGLPSAKVKIVRGGIDTELYRPEALPLSVPHRPAFAFLSVFDWAWRKGWDVLLTAYCREFRADEPVVLYLKIHQLVQEAVPISEVAYFLRSVVGTRAEDAPDVVLLTDPLSDREMASLYTAADAFVLPSRGEGYGRPYLEAMACGLPVIGTAWGGQTDFLTDATGYPLPIVGLEPVSPYEPRDIYRGLAWAQPDGRALRRLMRHLFTHPDEAKARGVAGRQAVVAGWDQRAVGAGLAEAIEALMRER